MAHSESVEIEINMALYLIKSMRHENDIDISRFLWGI